MKSRILNYKKISSSLCATALAVLSTTTQAETAAEQAVYSLAQGCYAIQSPENDKYLARYHKGGALDAGLGYIFNSTSLDNAGKFFFKPSALGHFLLKEQERYLATHLPLEVSSGDHPGSFAEWKVTAHRIDNTWQYQLQADKLQQYPLKHHYSNGGGLYLFDLTNPNNNGAENLFRLVKATGCSPFPEASLNLTIKDDSVATTHSIDEPVRGYIDAHVHITSNEFMGGKMMHGHPFHKYGIENALNDSKGVHGPSGSLDIIGNLIGYNDPSHRYDTKGYPELPFWPNQKQLSHMQLYYKWIERAHKGGLKMMVAYLVENEVLCNVQKTVNPASWINPNSCDVMDSMDLQIQRIREMQDYIDAQAGGPGKGFFRLVTSSQQARQVIADGKLAIMLGTETSEIFRCGGKDATCTEQHVDAGIDAIYDKGVRIFYPIHRFDNQFGGAYIQDGFINVGQALSSGHFFETKEGCQGGTKMTPGFPLIGNLPVIKNILDTLGLQPAYNGDNNAKHCNKRGLTKLGSYLVNRMIDKKMMIATDHMGPATATAVFEIAKQRQYSGIISDHRVTRTPDNFKTIASLGGYIGTYNFNSNAVSSDITNLQNIANQHQGDFEIGVGLSTDMGGLAVQGTARENSSLQYPFVSDDGRYEFEQQVTGNKAYNYNQTGIAHYGLMADHLADIRQVNTTAYESVMKSAEGYLKTLERVEKHNNNTYVDPLPDYFSFIDRKTGKCMDVPGDDNQLVTGAIMQLWDCQDHSQDQKWTYNTTTQKVHNKADPTMCLDNTGQSHHDGKVGLYKCVDHNNLRWVIDNGVLRNKNNGTFVATATGTHNGAPIKQQKYRGADEQVWDMRLANINSRWVMLKSGSSNKCLTVKGANTTPGTNLEISDCNGSASQQWKYNPEKENFFSKMANNLCLDSPHGNVNNHSVMQTWTCLYDSKGSSLSSQKFIPAGKTIRSQKSTSQVLDAAGENNGSPVITHHANGDQRQVWHGTVVHNPRPLVWANLVNERDKLCLVNSGGKLYVENKCNSEGRALWHYSESTQQIKNRDNNLCVDVKSSIAETHSHLLAYSCHGGDNQRFIRQGNTFRSALNTGLAIDASGAHGAAVILHGSNGGSNQNWSVKLP